MPSGAIECVACAVEKCAGKVGGRNPAGNRMDTDSVEEVEQVLRKSDANGHVAHGVFQDQVPTDDPSDEFSHRGVGISVRAPGDRNHGGKLGVAYRGESAGDSDQDKGESDRWAGAGASK